MQKLNTAPKKVLGLEAQSITKKLTLSLIMSILIAWAIAITAMYYVVLKSVKKLGRFEIWNLRVYRKSWMCISLINYA